jgi:hypothetical protein
MSFMDGRDLLVIGSLILLAISILLAFLGFPQAVVSALIGGVGTGAGILWKWLEKRPTSAQRSSSKSSPQSPEQEKAQSLVTYDKIMVDEAPTLRGKGRRDYRLSLVEGQRIRVLSNAAEGRYSIGLMSQTDFSLQKRSGKYDMEWYYEKQSGKITDTFKAGRRGTWYLSLWNEESYSMQIAVKVMATRGS